ncbi:MAG: hypothetical protein AAGF01_22930 [Cyanobacteria bacterium P01_G01_bin.38]
MLNSKRTIGVILLLFIVSASSGSAQQALQASPSEISTPDADATRRQPASQGLTLDADKLFGHALQLARTADIDPYRRAQMLSEIALQLTYANRIEQAETVFADVLEFDLAQATLNESARSEKITLNLAKAGRFDQALEKANQIQAASLRIKTQASIAEEMAVAGQIEPAKTLLLSALEEGQALTDGYMSNGSCYIAKGDALSVVAASLAKAQQIDAALLAASQTPNCQTGTGFWLYYQTPAYDTIIDQLETLGAVQGVYRDLPAPDEETGEYYGAHTAIAIKLAELGDLTQAQQIIDTFRSADFDDPVSATIRTNRARGHQAIAIAVAKQEDLEAALEFLEKSSLTADNNAVSLERSLALIGIGEQVAQRQQPQAATRVFTQAIAPFNSQNPPFSQEDVLEILQALVDANQVDLALPLISSDGRPDIIGKVALGLADAGEYEAALDLINTLPDEDYQSVKVAAIATLAAQLEKASL